MSDIRCRSAFPKRVLFRTVDGVEPEPFELDGMLGDEDENFNDGDIDDDRQPGDHSSVGHSNSHPRRFGRVETPLRVEPPPSFNAPVRPVEQTQEQHIKARTTSYLLVHVPSKCTDDI